MTDRAIFDQDDPLAAYPGLLDQPTSAEEEERRLHITDYLLTAVDVTSSYQDRLNAIEHVLVCDPVRGIAAMVELCRMVMTEMEDHYGDPPGTAASKVRERLVQVKAIKRGDYPFAKILDDLLEGRQ